MAAKKWTAFVHDGKGFNYAGAALKKNWPRLHAGDQEPYPDAKLIGEGLESVAVLKKILKGDAKAITAALEDAWRAFHAGEFQLACERGDALGAFGAVVATKASGIYATYLCQDETTKLALLQAGAERCEAALKLLPKWANAHYFQAFALGRYSQGISITKALAQGLGGKIKASLKTTLELAPKHAEAHTAMGMYHAEIIHKIGGMVGKLTYGASSDESIKHFETARKLTPKAPVAHLEYGKGLLLLHGKRKQDEAVDAFQQATECEPCDAMEALDAAHAREQFEA